MLEEFELLAPLLQELLAGQLELRELPKYSAFAADRQRHPHFLPHATHVHAGDRQLHRPPHRSCGRPTSIFADDAKADIRRHASGLPRIVN